MPVFEYKAAGPDRGIQKGTIDRDSPRHARQALRELGLQVLEIAPAKPTSSFSIGKFKTPQLLKKNWDGWVAEFTGELSTLLSVGVPLLEALDTLVQQYTRKPKMFVLHLKDQVASGTPLARAMAGQPETFDNLCIKMVEVGEKTGTLDQVLGQLSDFKHRSLEFKDKVVSAMLYPMIVLAVSIAVSIFLMTVVVPMLLENLADTGRPLPLPTQILKTISDLLLVHGWWLAIIAGVGLVGSVSFFKTPNGKRLWDRLILSTPVIGKMGQKQELARVSLIISTLLKSGVGFVEAIEIAIGTTKNTLLHEALTDCAKRIESGTDIGDALKAWSYFPPIVTQVFTVGQKTGRLEEMLGRLADDYDGQVASTSGRLSVILEPVLILMLSFFVGFILFATLLPVLEAGNVL